MTLFHSLKFEHVQAWQDRIQRPLYLTWRTQHLGYEPQNKGCIVVQQGR